MDTVSMRELNQKTSGIVREVATTHHAVTITSNNKPVGVQLVPVERGLRVLDQLVAAGRATAPAVHGPITAPPEHDAEVDAAAALAADRDEERGYLPGFSGRGRALPHRARDGRSGHLAAGIRQAPLVPSAPVEVEAPRALRRRALPSMPVTPDRLYRVEIDHTVRATAAAYADHGLRSLDAIHLATAHVLGGTSGEELTFVTYVRRLLASAEQLELTVASPGQQ